MNPTLRWTSADLAVLPDDGKCYSRRDVVEYWIVDWRAQRVEVYRREELVLRLVATLYPADTLTSPLLPGFACQVATLF